MRRDDAQRAAARARRKLRAFALAAAWLGAAGAGIAQESATPGIQRGRLTVSFAEYFECAVEDAFVRGESVLVTGGSFLANEPVAVKLVHDGGEIAIGTVRATPRGGLSATVAIPADAPTEGDVRLVATAEKGEVGGGVWLRSPPLRIFPDARDTDGDGVQDRCDTCPSVASPNLEDGDVDGLGDVCDPCPSDSDNDSDGDGLCADVDPNPYAPEPGTRPAPAPENG
jgi:hypothetical protein